MANQERNTHRKTAVIVGVLFIIATAFLFIGEAIYKPILDSPAFLDLAYPNRSTVTLGILLEFTIVLAIPLIPIVFFPVLRKHSEVLAVGYVVFRALESVILITVAEINKLSLIGLSQAYLNAEQVDAAYFQAIASGIQAENLWGDTSGVLYNVVFVIGAVILYLVLYQSKLIPRWLSVWGFMACATLLTAALASPFVTLPAIVNVLLVFPIAVQEMVMALWLIFKGFNLSALKPGTRQSGQKRKLRAARA